MAKLPLKFARLHEQAVDLGAQEGIGSCRHSGGCEAFVGGFVLDRGKAFRLKGSTSKALAKEGF